MPLILLTLFLLSPSFLATNHHRQSFLVFWNIRQGQWITYVDTNYCHHFDVGGMRAPLRLINQVCGSKQNTLWISHQDKSHWRNLRKLKPRPCLAYSPTINDKQLAKLPSCHFVSENVQVILSKNNQAVYLLNKRILITGDAPQGSLPRIDYDIASAPQGGNSPYLKQKRSKLWICQPQYRNKKQLRGCLSTSSHGNIAIQL